MARSILGYLVDGILNIHVLEEKTLEERRQRTATDQGSILDLGFGRN